MPSSSPEVVNRTSTLSARALSQTAGEVAAILQGPPPSSSNPLTVSLTSTNAVSSTTTTSGSYINIGNIL